MANSVLLVDDDKDFREEFRDFLHDYDVVEARNGEEAIEILSRPNEIDVVLLDVVMPGLSGIEILKRVKDMCPDVAVVMLTGHGSKSTVIEALKGRADDYIEKPVDIHKTREILERLILDRMATGLAAPGGTDARIERVMRFLERNYEKRVSLKSAAKLVALSPKYFSRVFKIKAGVGFDEYRLRVRIDKAAELLESTDYTVDEISFRVGYKNPESFIRLFKRMKGSTPTQYRKTKRIGKGKRTDEPGR